MSRRLAIVLVGFVAACSARSLSEYEDGMSTNGGSGGDAGTTGTGATGGSAGMGGVAGSGASGGFGGSVGGSGGSAGASCSPACGGNAPICKPATLTCVECLENTDCSNNSPVCKNQSTCVDCLGDGDCGGSTPHCDTQHDNCVQCLSNSNCQSSELCHTYDGKCQQKCTTTAECTAPTTPLCKTSAGILRRVSLELGLLQQPTMRLFQQHLPQRLTASGHRVTELPVARLY